MLLPTLCGLILASSVSSFVIPFKTAAVSNVTQHSQVLSEYNSLSSGYWYTNITIGTPAQVFTVVIDTFAGSTWVVGMKCMPSMGGPGCSNKTMFDSSKSSTFMNKNMNFLNTDHFGMASGMIGMDKVQLGNDDGKAIVVPMASFGMISQIPSKIAPIQGVQGVLGLAFPPQAVSGAEPVLTTAIRQQDVTAGIFTIWLEDQYETSDIGTHGVIYYGNNDPLHCKYNQRSYHVLSKASYFQVTIPSFQLNGVTTYSKPTQAIFDTTSLYISAPPTVVDSVLGSFGLHPTAQLPATVPCNSTVDFGFNFSGDLVHVTQLNLILKQADGTCKLALLKSLSKNFDNGLRFELGVPFFRGRCTYFDVADHAVGFSDAKTHGGETH